MKKILLIVFSLLHFCWLFAQPTITLSKTIGGLGGEVINDLSALPNGHILALCSADSNSGDVNCTLHGKSDVWVVEMDAEAKILWQYCYGGSDDELPYQIIQTTDGGFLFSCITSSNDGDISVYHGNEDIWLVKIDSDGTMQWNKSIGSSGGDKPYDLIQLKDGRYLLACYSLGNNFDFPIHYGVFNQDAWMVFISDSGSIDTSIHYGGSGDDYITQIIELPNGNLQMFGYTESSDYDLQGITSHGNWDGWFLKTDANGNIIHQTLLGFSGPDAIIGAVRLVCGGFLVAGDSNTDIWCMKLDSNGNKKTENFHGGSSSETMDGRRRILEAGNNTFTIGARTYSNDGEVGINYGEDDYWFLTVDSNGEYLNSKVSGGSSYDEMYCNIVLNSNIGIQGGFTTSNDFDISNYHGNGDGWIIKIENFTGLDEVSTHQKNTISIFPNPAHDIASVYMDMGTVKLAKTLDLYNLQGQFVCSYKIGKSSNQFSVTEISKGLYLFQLKGKTGQTLGSGNFMVQ